MLQEHTIAPGGTHVEVLGSYDPRLKKAVLKEERIKYWVSQGVKVSDTAYNLFLKQGVLTGEKRKVKIPAKKVEEVAAEVPTVAKPEEVKTESAEASKAEAATPVVEPQKEEKAEEAPKPEEKKEEAKFEEAKAE
jgi:ribosomal protein S16